jgi:hypothetical protein
MREIKVRALSRGKWIYGKLAYPNSIFQGDTNGLHIELTPGTRLEDISFADPETVGLFTGKYDNINREIYEGDIDESRGVVEWNDEEAGFQWRNHEDGFLHDWGYIYGPIHIIGNIHDGEE